MTLRLLSGCLKKQKPVFNDYFKICNFCMFHFAQRCLPRLIFTKAEEPEGFSAVPFRT